MASDRPDPAAGSASGDPLAAVDAILREFADEASAVRDAAGLEDLTARYVGRKRGRLTSVLKGLRDLPPEHRRDVGNAANRARAQITEQIQTIESQLRAGRASAASAVDVTLPGIDDGLGGLHPNTQTLDEIIEVFVSLGYEIVDGPEVETDWYNFGALNFPDDHPARDEQDTLVLSDDLLLRTHTSPMQIRFMETHEPPLAILVPGRVYRRDTPDATHTPMFVQCEGLVVDRDITMADLKGTLDAFAKAMFGPETATRFRPGYFPFTEPSAEVDATCPACGGDGCRVCKGSGWVELLGCGMVHPALFENVGYDPEKVQGFAFGMGIDRITSVRHGIEDIRLLYDNDLRFLRQFAD